MEAVTMVGGAILAPLFESLFKSLGSIGLFTYVDASEVSEEVRKWKSMLETIFAVLNKSEEQQTTDEVVRSWFSDLRDLAYDAEDIVDEFDTHARKREYRAETESKAGKLLRCGFRLSADVKYSVGMVYKVKKVSQRFGEIKTRMDLSKSVAGTINRVNEEIHARPLDVTSLPEQKVCGREEDHKAIVNLMKKEAGKAGISVITIVGMGGVGKTTLARMIYNDDSLQFDFKAWVSIGEDFNLITVTKAIVKSEDNDLNSLQSKLKEKLSGKKFLIVLDDLWSDNYEKWDLFYRPFTSGAPGSRIIITTQNKKVSSTTSTGDGYPLQGLSHHLEVLPYNDCLSLFAHHALDKKDFSEHMELMEVGQEIVRKCNGLPLAVKALGGLLRGRAYLNVWKNLLHDKLWEENNTILPALRLSYYNLPSSLKRCFAYCAIFSKEYEFDRDDLVLLWLAEGFLHDLSQAYDCFNELFARSLLEKSAINTSAFVMHDLINDLARSISGEVCLNLDEERCKRESYGKVRHSAFNRGEFDVALRFENFQHMKSLRTVLALPVMQWDTWNFNYISSKVLDVWIPKLKLLRVLSLSGYERVELPKSIAAMQHLRYLNLSRAKIVTLPEYLSRLFNLQVLILSNCKKLRKLPEDFCNLINLQCVDLRGTDGFEEMPLHIGKLPKLHRLTKFIVGSTDGRRIEELRKIPNLQGEVHITELQNVASTEVADCLWMKQNEKINKLMLEWTSNFDVSRDEENEKQVLKALQPQNNIALLAIISYGGTEFPTGFSNDLFKLTALVIGNCRNVPSLPPLGGLPLLKELTIQSMPGIKEVGAEFYGMVSSSPSSSSSCCNVFPSLEILYFIDMEHWNVWSCCNDVEYEGKLFPKLRELSIMDCPELVGDFPKGLHSLEKLVIMGCKEAVLKRMPGLGSLTKLEINRISGRVSFNVAFPNNLKSLQELEVDYCGELQHLWENGTAIERLGSLKVLRIEYCKNLVSLVEGEEGIFPPNLQLLKISDCDNLQRLPNQLHNLTSLTTLEIDTCQKLVTFPTGGLPDNVKEVQIYDCRSLKRLPEGILVDQKGNKQPYSRIEKLDLRRVKPIVPSNQVFPASLKSLWITEGLETQLMESLQIHNHFSLLTQLGLKGYLESFPASGLPIPTIRNLRLNECGNLRSLPCNMHDLTSLQTLELYECRKIECFPETGLPPNLSELEIKNCDTLEKQPLSEWRLSRLHRLQRLEIEGAMETVSYFPHDSLPLPNSLTYLSIKGFQNLKSISSKIQRLTSLQKLVIWKCSELQYLPKEGLPPSLGSLWIYDCSLVKEKCKTGEGKYWSRLAHIPDFRYLSPENPIEYWD